MIKMKKIIRMDINIKIIEIIILIIGIISIKEEEIIV